METGRREFPPTGRRRDRLLMLRWGGVMPAARQCSASALTERTPVPPSAHGMSLAASHIVRSRSAADRVARSVSMVTPRQPHVIVRLERSRSCSGQSLAWALHMSKHERASRSTYCRSSSSRPSSTASLHWRPFIHVRRSFDTSAPVSSLAAPRRSRGAPRYEARSAVQPPPAIRTFAGITPSRDSLAITSPSHARLWATTKAPSRMRQSKSRGCPAHENPSPTTPIRYTSQRGSSR